VANSLLDFVMSLVRDPAVAAQYAADPAQTLADAHLTDVTSADVSNLIPVVTESLSMSGPADNVWASGAATAAFDAFDDHVPSVVDADAGVPTIVDHFDQQLDVPTAVGSAIPDHLDVATPESADTWAAAAPDVVDDLPVHPAVDVAPVADDQLDHLHDHSPGFDLF
jgi:hypothetical protein